MKPVNLHFVEAGEGPAVMLLHGYPLDHSIWNPIVPLLTRDARLIMPDLRGHGKSPSPEGVYSMKEMAGDLLRLMGALKVDKVILVGHSMGGYVAESLLHQYPHKVSGLALVASRAKADSKEKIVERLRTAEQVLKSGVDAVTDSMLAKLTSKPSLQLELKKIMMEASPMGVAGSLRGIAEREDATAWLPKVIIPSLVVAGEIDQIVPLEESRSLAELIPDCELVIAKDCGHMPMMESPGLTAGALFKLIKRCS
jgi:3-oxoadipate enol-lactonase